MGYRSDVCIGLTDAATRLFKTMLDHLPETHEAHQLAKDAVGSYRDIPFDAHRKPHMDLDCKMYWDHVKWYEGYECVDFMHCFLEHISEEDFRFVRVGDSSDDIEEIGSYYDSDIYIARSISW